MSNDLRTRPHTSDTSVTRGGTGSARTMTIIGFVCAAVALFLLPIPLGVAAIVLGIVAYTKGDRLGMWAAIAGGAAIVINLVVLAALLANK
jgi:hypothetical protein